MSIAARNLFSPILRLPKWRLFMVFVAIAAAIAALVSLFTYRTLLDTSGGKPLTIAVLAPLSGPDQRAGEAVRDGVAQWVDEANRMGGVAGRLLNLATFDEAEGEEALRRITRNPDVLAVIGPLGDPALRAATDILAGAGIPAITPAALPSSLGPDRSWALPVSADSLSEVRFLANYVRNIVGEQLVSIIRQEGAEGERLAAAFDEVMQRFGTRVVYSWAVPAEAGKDGIAPVAAEITERKIAGTLLVLGDARFNAHAVAALREAAVPNRIVGTRALATDAFRAEFDRVWRGPTSIGAALNGTLMTTPLLFDTAGLEAQRFRTVHVSRTGRAPDWLATLSYQSAQLLGQALDSLDAPRQAAGVELRDGFRQALLARDAASGFDGILGPVSFDARGRGALPTLVGSYEGTDLIAWLTQLTPIREEGVSNYIQELVAGRALYVNDRFMYRTNVVYSGIRLSNVSGLDLGEQTVDLQFVLWFRWKEGFDPLDIVFPTAVEPITLGEPEREAQVGDLTYRAYRVTGKFFLNFTNVNQPFGTELVNIQFRHRSMGRNNVMYVSDVLGMELVGPRARTVERGQENQLALLLSGRTDRSPLTLQLEETNVLAGAPGWVVERSWLSQEVARGSSEGDPVFVGFGRPAPDFSTLSLGLLLKRDTIDFRAIVPSNLTIYIAIFALSGAILAALLDRKDRGQFWRIQTLLLRVICWPALLMGVGNLTLDYAVANFTPGVVEAIDLLNHTLWWFVPARLAAITVERFIWSPLEARTNRKVPDVVRMIVAGIIYLLAAFGVVAFVLGETITSLLATSGLLAMIVGLAVQSNLNDIFSGIMLNLERAFLIRDRVRINEVEGEVVDITWRSTKIREEDGHLVSLPNGTVASAEIHNLSARADLTPTSDVFSLSIQLPAKYDPQRVMAVIEEACASFEGYPFTVDDVSVGGVAPQDRTWAVTYEISGQTEDRTNLSAHLSEIWVRLWRHLHAAGMGWDTAETPALPDLTSPLLEPAR